MKIHNESKYFSYDLRKIFRVCCKEISRREGERYSPVVTVQDHRAAYVGGWAWYNSRKAIIKLPAQPWLKCWSNNQWHEDYSCFAAKIADTLIHEAGHNLGAKHHKGNTIEHGFQDWIRATFNEEQYPVRVVEKKAKVVDIQEVRYQRALKNYKKAWTRLKRARTLHRKWSKKVQYYQAKAAERAVQEKS